MILNSTTHLKYNMYFLLDVKASPSTYPGQSVMFSAVASTKLVLVLVLVLNLSLIIIALKLLGSLLHWETNSPICEAITLALLMI